MRRINPWQLLNVRPGDPVEVLKSNYKAAMLNAHPDRGGTEEAAVILNHAYAFLSDHLVNDRVPGPVEAGLRPAHEVMQPRAPTWQGQWRVVQVTVVNGGATTVRASTNYDPWQPTGGWRPW